MDPERLAALIDARLSEEERALLLAELARSDDGTLAILADTAAARDELARDVTPIRRRLQWVVPLAAAAAVTAIWLGWPPEAPFARLGRLAGAPALAVLPVRGGADSAALLVRQGMDAYLAGRYREAAPLFARADSLSPSETATFYRGVSALLGGDAVGAIDVLRPVMSSADRPYAAEAHFYSAKAWLRQGRADSALVNLAAISTGGGALAAHAAALADSVKAVMR